MKFLVNEQQKSYKNAKICYVCNDKFEAKHVKVKNILKSGIIVIIQVNIKVVHICNLKYSIPKGISLAFHNGSNYDYHFIIKNIAEEFKT